MPSRPRTSSGEITLRAALLYAGHGIPVVPFRADEKRPLTRRGVHDASTDPKRIAAWWRRWPDASLALACGARAGFDALDVDRRHGGFTALNVLVAEHGALPGTSMQATPSDGRHYLFRHRPGLKNRSGGQGVVPKGLDCRTQGATILAAPTPGYHWQQLLPLEDLPPWPEWLAGFFLARAEEPLPGAHPIHLDGQGADRATQYIMAAIEGLAEDIAAASFGAQEATLNAACFRAGRLLAAAQQIDQATVEARLVAAGLRMANQPKRPRWRHVEIGQKVRRALNDGRRQGPPRLPDFDAIPHHKS